MSEVSGLEVKQLSYIAPSRQNQAVFALDDISFSLPEGYFMTLLGKNAAGKSTLLDLLYGVLPQRSGEILWDGMAVTASRVNRLAFQKQIAYVPQVSSFSDGASMRENVELFRLLYQSFEEDDLMEALQKLEIAENLMKKPMAELSKGQQVAFRMAFALATRPKLLLLDEPMANLDPVIKTDLLQLIQDAVAQREMSVLLSTHLVEEITDMTDYVGVLGKGRMVAFGEKEDVLGQMDVTDFRQLLQKAEV